MQLENWKEKKEEREKKLLRFFLVLACKRDWDFNFFVLPSTFGNVLRGVKLEGGLDWWAHDVREEKQIFALALFWWSNFMDIITHNRNSRGLEGNVTRNIFPVLRYKNYWNSIRWNFWIELFFIFNRKLCDVLFFGNLVPTSFWRFFYFRNDWKNFEFNFFMRFAVLWFWKIWNLEKTLLKIFFVKNDWEVFEFNFFFISDRKMSSKLEMFHFCRVWNWKYWKIKFLERKHVFPWKMTW